MNILGWLRCKLRPLAGAVVMPDKEKLKLFDLFVKETNDIFWHMRDLYPQDGRIRTWKNTYRRYNALYTVFESDDYNYTEWSVATPPKLDDCLIKIKRKHGVLWLTCEGADKIPPGKLPDELTFGCMFSNACVTDGLQLTFLPELQQSFILDIAKRYKEFKCQLK